MIVRRMVEVHMRAEAGPIGDPVEKALIAKVQPIRLSKLAKKPFFQSPQSKNSGTLLK